MPDAPQADPPRWRDLGDANSWGKPPDAHVACTAEKHKVTGREIGRCYWEYCCPICRITWRIDSSD